MTRDQRQWWWYGFNVGLTLGLMIGGAVVLVAALSS